MYTASISGSLGKKSTAPSDQAKLGIRPSKSTNRGSDKQINVIYSSRNNIENYMNRIQPKRKFLKTYSSNTIDGGVQLLSNHKDKIV